VGSGKSPLPTFYLSIIALAPDFAALKTRKKLFEIGFSHFLQRNIPGSNGICGLGKNEA
jgi:hypothetical protein